MFARRLRQLGLPLDPLDVAYGMATRVVHLRSATGAHLGTAWQRSLRSTGATVFGGLYSITDVLGQRRDGDIGDVLGPQQGAAAG